MTAGELIKLLRQFPKDTRVVIPGYEAGLDDVESVKETFVALNVNNAWYYGPHEESSIGVPAVKIS